MGNMDIKGKTSVKAFAIVLVAFLFITGCHGNHDYSPKPRGYFRIAFPKKEYQNYEEGCPFTFSYPKYATIEPDKNANAKPCWINMQFKQFNGTLHLTYDKVNSKKEFNELTEDAYKFVFKHTVKSTGIDQATINLPTQKIYGIYYTIDGNAASSLQFYLTDSTKNYLRGALYFNSEPRLDSIQPVLNFIKKDVDVMIKSFRWKQAN
jgi:gliding motility-associated lipoprotein GldD